MVSIMDEGGMIWESSENYATMDEAMQALETTLADGMKQLKSKGAILYYTRRKNHSEFSI